MPRYANIKIDVLEAIAVAASAYAENGNTIVKYDKDKRCNKDIIVDHFLNDVKVDHMDLDQAQLIKQEISHHITMASISGNTIPKFVMDVYEAIKDETASSRVLGYINWAPKIAEDIQKAGQIRSELYRVSSTSRYIGQPKKSIRITYNDISNRYIEYYQSYVHIGTDEHGNLISFYSKNKIASGSIITAKVKLHGRGRNQLQGHDVTYLHYVKVSK